MVSTLPLCLFVLAMTVVSSQEISGESEFLEETPISERRSFKHKRPFKVLPLIKKHKKFGGWLPSVFAKTEYAEVPAYQEIPVRPIYKFQRYHGFDVKPVSTVHSISISGPETIDSNLVEPSSDYAPAYTSYHDYAPTFASDHSFPPAPPPSSGFFLHPVHDKPVFSSPIFSYAPAAPIFSSLPISIPPVALPPAHVFPTVSIAKPAPAPIIAAPPALPVLSAPAFSLPLPAPAPAPAFSFPVRFPPAIFPAPSPAPAFSSISVLPSPSTPVFSPLPSPSPAPVLPSLPALSIPASHGPEYPYPPSGTPVPSYIKDISLPEVSVTPTPSPTSVTVVTPHYEEVTKTLGVVENTKTFDHGLLQKLKDWKAEKANQAISHFNYFKPKPAVAVAVAPTLASPHHAPIQFPNPHHSLPLAHDFRHPSVFFSPPKYENFPPNNIESPPLFNSYGVPIPHDSYSTVHGSHDRLSPEASEEDPSVLPPPRSLGESQPEADSVELKKPEVQQPQTQLGLGFQPQNFKPQFQPQALLSQQQPIYVPEENQKVNEEIKTIEVVTPVKNSQPEETQEPEDPELQNHGNDRVN